jgi:hypothetical protein
MNSERECQHLNAPNANNRSRWLLNKNIKDCELTEDQFDRWCGRWGARRV